MKDLDFDELDKAVNSLMAGVPKTNDAAVPAAPLDGAVPEAPAVAPVAAMPSPTPAAEPPKPPVAPAAPLAARRGGRFMDVVRPGAVTPKPAAPRAPISRQAADIAPMNPTAAPEPVTATPPSPVAPPAVNEWPDPLEMTSRDMPDSALKTAPEALENHDEAPLTTPFLSDAKVEKRPLGALATELSTAAPELEEVKSTAETNADLPATAKDVAPLLPEELHSSVMAIESDATTASPEMPTPPAETKLWQPAASAPPATTEVNPEKEPSTGPTSIAQQYREEPSTGDQNNGAIFDTDTYHQPLSHPAQKKSGWMWVVWIILILLVGAAGGAALYLFRIV